LNSFVLFFLSEWRTCTNSSCGRQYH
jgi:hypothetical protein